MSVKTEKEPVAIQYIPGMLMLQARLWDKGIRRTDAQQQQRKSSSWKAPRSFTRSHCCKARSIAHLVRGTCAAVFSAKDYGGSLKNTPTLRSPRPPPASRLFFILHLYIFFTQQELHTRQALQATPSKSQQDRGSSPFHSLKEKHQAFSAH